VAEIHDFRAHEFLPARQVAWRPIIDALTLKVFQMLIFMLSLVLVAVVSSIGALVVRAIAHMPLSMLARSADAGRYSRLESRGPSSPHRHVAGRRAAANRARVLPAVAGRAWLSEAVQSAAAAAAHSG
jgi:hypothetical protein